MKPFLRPIRFAAAPTRIAPHRPLVSISPANRNGAASSPRIWSTSFRNYSAGVEEQVEAPEYLSEGERKVFDMIKEGLQPSKLEVQDISGGCGSMYALDIVSNQFKDLPVIKQHRLVNKILGDEMKKWHGVQLKTKAP